MRKILINVPLKILCLSALLGSAHCDKIEIPVTERRISCETQTLRAPKEEQDIPLCPDGNGHSAFSQPDMAIMIGQCTEWKKRLEECERTCK